MWLVGYLFNHNGMGTWCWETAHALAAAGEPVTLVCAENVSLPGPTSIPLLRIAAPPLQSLSHRLFAPGGMLSRHGPRVMRAALTSIQSQGVVVKGILLNSTEFYDAAIEVPQFVVAWARGISLAHYVGRFMRERHESLRVRTRSALSTIGWWRRDWYAYRRASQVLAVSSPLYHELRRRGVRSSLLYPCTHAGTANIDRRAGPARLVTSAVSLTDPRKRVRWMLDALRGLSGGHVTLTLIGYADDSVRAAAERVPMEVRFTGSLSRDDALEEMAGHDVFLFASGLDDWGYVVTEAMSRGLAVVAPRISPFDEILADTGALYALESTHEFLAAVHATLIDLQGARRAAYARATQQFSRSAFVEGLRGIIG